MEKCREGYSTIVGIAGENGTLAPLCTLSASYETPIAQGQR